MRNPLSFSVLLVSIACVAVGCANAERKFGRGLNNATEFARLGEIRRSMEQTALWDNTEMAYTTGAVRGFNRSLVRTGVGIYEMLTFPFPSYDPIFLPESPVFPDNYRPQRLADPTFGPDAILGFSGGDVAPMIPGSRFRIFDY
jgi:putative exosortase-associated protein (TIGR04073 family)